MAKFSVYCAFADGTQAYKCLLVDLLTAIKSFLDHTTNLSANDGSTRTVLICRDISEGDGGIIAEWRHGEGYIWPADMTAEKLIKHLERLRDARESNKISVASVGAKR